jgi:hypothetical protein
VERRSLAVSALMIVTIVALLTLLPAAALAKPAHRLHHHRRTTATVAHPSVVMTGADVKAIRAQIAAGAEPVTSAFTEFMGGWVRIAMQNSPRVFAGPYRGVEDWNHVFDTLNEDGGRARDLGIAFALTADRQYAVKCREYLIAWAAGNTPTTQQDYDGNDMGYHQAFGAFDLAYAYDLTYDSGVYSQADRAVIAAYFKKFIYAIGTANAKIAGDWVIQHPDAMKGYQWDGTKQYRWRDTYIGGDAALLGQSARLAMAHVIGDRATENDILNNKNNALNLSSMLSSALTPKNDGDGVQGHPVPAPHVYVYATNSPGRGGMLDYMTYNTRACSVLVEMADHFGWDRSKVADAKAKLRTTWDYLGRFFGPNAEPNFNPMDVVNVNANLPRFELAWHQLGVERYQQIAASGDQVEYYEPQLLGPITVTHSIAE